MNITMAGRLDECILLAYRTPAESVRALVPPTFDLLTRGGSAFWNVVACRVGRMRPAGLPAAAGVTYHHVAYRLYVRRRIAGGEALDGLYFVRSDADSLPIARLGNLLSDFRFRRSTIHLAGRDGGRVTLRVRGRDDAAGDADACVSPAREPALDAGSPFATAAEAAAFLKYRPLGLAPSRDGRRVKLAEVFRDEAQWRETPVAVESARWAFFDELGQRDVRLETATRVAPIVYRWRLGAWRGAAPRPADG